MHTELSEKILKPIMHAITALYSAPPLRTAEILDVLCRIGDQVVSSVNLPAPMDLQTQLPTLQSFWKI